MMQLLFGKSRLIKRIESNFVKLCYLKKIFGRLLPPVDRIGLSRGGVKGAN